jgi:hypothetical protein
VHLHGFLSQIFADFVLSAVMEVVMFYQSVKLLDRCQIKATADTTAGKQTQTAAADPGNMGIGRKIRF